LSGLGFGGQGTHASMLSMGAPGLAPPAYGQSRISLAPSEIPLGMINMQQPRGSVFGDVEMNNLSNTAGLPSDDALLAEIRDILSTADLMSITKKSVKLELERRFGVGLDGKRTYINSGMLPCLGIP
jgi:chitin synthase